MVRAMGERIALGVVAVLVACGLSGATAPAQAVPVEATPAAAAEWQPTYGIDPGLADKLVAETPRGATPDAVTKNWDCQLTINLDYAAAPGIDIATLREQLAYPVRYLQDLGYTAAIGVEVPYSVNMPMPSTPGAVIIVATSDRAEQPALATATYRAAAETVVATNVSVVSGRITVMSTNGMASDVILHELGHVLGLKHKDGTVMAEAATDSVSFDAAETAAIDCRLPEALAR